MGNKKLALEAELYNRKAQSVQAQPEQVLSSLNIQSGSTVMDLGAGGGYYAMRFSEAVGQSGQVYAVDSNADMLDYVGHYMSLLQKNNIEVIHTKGGVPNVPENSCDLIFVRNVYHHLENPTMFFLALSSKLKQGGRVAILDYKPKGGFNFISLFKHHVEESDIESSMVQAGYKMVKKYDFLKSQSFSVFEKV